MAANGRPGIVVGRVTRVERQVDAFRDVNLVLHLESAERPVSVFVTSEIREIVERRLGGDTVVGRTIAVRMNPLEMFPRGPIILMPPTPDRIEIFR
jgi:hypothetical protein